MQLFKRMHKPYTTPHFLTLPNRRERRCCARICTSAKKSQNRGVRRKHLIIREMRDYDRKVRMLRCAKKAYSHRKQGFFALKTRLPCTASTLYFDAFRAEKGTRNARFRYMNEPLYELAARILGIPTPAHCLPSELEREFRLSKKITVSAYFLTFYAITDGITHQIFLFSYIYFHFLY